MKYSNKTKMINRAGVAWLVATLAFVCFIFSRSLTPAEQSAQESGSTMGAINQLFAFLNISAQVTDYIVRKAGHFTEFFIYGILLTVTVCYLLKPNQIKQWCKSFVILFFALAVPVADETMQYFSPGRSPQVNDVLLDFCAAVSAFVLTSILLYFLDKRKKSKRKLKS